jgi:DNA-binding NarL/FixJ family response regulator
MITQAIMIAKKNVISEGIANQIAACTDIKIVDWVTEAELIHDAYRSLNPNCIILSGAFFSQDTGRTIKAFIQQNPDANILVVSNNIDRQFVNEVMESGARGIISPAFSTFDRLANSIRTASYSKNINYQESVTEIHHISSIHDDQNELMTIREIEIIKTIASGWSSKEIAKIFDISPATVDVHKRNIMKKLGVNNAVEITKYAIKSSIFAL